MLSEDNIFVCGLVLSKKSVAYYFMLKTAHCGFNN